MACTHSFAPDRRRTRTIGLALSSVLATASAALAQNDECAAAAVLSQGATYFDTTGATASAAPWACATAGADLWYRYTTSSAQVLTIDTCASTFDTVVEAFSGACGSLSSIACNDNGCGIQSSLTLSNLPSGTTVTIRVGGALGVSGVGLLRIFEVPAPPNCVETIFDFNGGGAVGGAMYFDLTAASPISVSGVTLNTVSTSTGIGVDLYTTAGTHVGNESNAAAWTLVGMGLLTGTGQGFNQRTALDFVAPVVLPAGTMGVALVAHGFAHSYTNGNGSNQSFTSPSGLITIDLGSASNIPFAPGVFIPRVWNGELCAANLLCSCLCSSNPNSTGLRGAMIAGGSTSVATNDLVLAASQLPTGALAYFITSRTQGFFPNPNGSSGNLCLGGAIGRFVGPGQVGNTGASGAILIVTDNSMQPTPTGLVQVLPGQSWTYQAWHRDTLPSGVATSNFTDAFEVIYGM